MLCLTLTLLLVVPQSGEGPLIHSMDDIKIRDPKEKAHSEMVEGKIGKAVKFTFEEGSSGAFCITPLHGTPEWDQAAGFSFWVKGDGSKHFGGLQFIWNEDYAARYDFMFPIDGTEWKKITVAWRELVPVMASPNSKPLDP
ncbi:MAG TPA: carbohydrate binding domain-containing protein, partial [Planctomycetota bacterium]|nr:carbohydrate binding domain-containing protein [Planctomycetota bacterium]